MEGHDGKLIASSIEEFLIALIVEEVQSSPEYQQKLREQEHALLFGDGTTPRLGILSAKTGERKRDVHCRIGSPRKGLRWRG